MRRNSPRHHTPHDVRLSAWVARITAALLLCVTVGCAHLLPVLGQVVSRVDVSRVIQCARLPDAESKARCLGVAVLTPAVDVALQRAEAAAHRALDRIDPPNGAEVEADPRADRSAARDLEAALEDLAIAISEAPHE
jgi:hypothetical protein